MSLLTVFKKPVGPSGFGFASTALEVTEGLDLTGKTIVITGVNTGLGRETARVLALRGAKIYGTVRSQEKALKVQEELGSSVHPILCDLSEPSSVNNAVDVLREFNSPIDAIICNAGVMALPICHQKHGIELQFLTNHLGHFNLVISLLDLLVETGRVVLVSSRAHTNPYAEGIQFDNLEGTLEYSRWRAYGQSKLANLLFARELATRMPHSSQSAFAVHPGVIKTELVRHFNPLVRLGASLGGALFFKSVEQGAATQSYVAVHPGISDLNGEYFSDNNVKESSDMGRDMDMAKRLWETSMAFVEKF